MEKKDNYIKVLLTTEKKERFKKACKRAPMSSVLEEFIDFFIEDSNSLDYLKDRIKN